MIIKQSIEVLIRNFSMEGVKEWQRTVNLGRGVLVLLPIEVNSKALTETM